MVRTLLEWLRLSKKEGLKTPILLGVLNVLDLTFIFTIIYVLNKIMGGTTTVTHAGLSINLVISCVFIACLKFINYNIIVYLIGNYSYRFCANSIVEQLQLLVQSASEIVESDDIKRVEKLITQNNYLVASGLQNFVILISEVILILIIFTFLIIKYGAYVLLVTAAIFIIFMIYYHYLKPKLNYVAVERQAIFTSNLDRVKDVAKFAPLAKVYNVQDRLIDSSHIQRIMVDVFTRYLIYQANPRLFFELIGIIFICLMLYSMTLLSITIPQETLIIFVAITLRLLPSVGKIGQNLNQLQMSNEALTEFNNSKGKLGSNLLDTTNSKLLINNKEHNLEQQRWILIDGPSGTGKSTSIRAALGLGHPHDKPKLDIQIPNRLKVSYVPQQSYVRNVNLEDNITFYRLNVNYHRVQELIRLLDLEKVQSILKNDKNASSLSGGERQRISLARALIDKPDLIFLDEAFTSVSEKQTARVIEWMKDNLPHTMVIGITHNAVEKAYYQEVISIK